MTKKLIRTILTSWLLFSSLYLSALAETATPVGNAPTKYLIKKSAEAQFSEGSACLAQSNITCAKMALALIPNISPYAKILEGALALQSNQTEQALLALLPVQADETLTVPAQIMLHRTLALAFVNVGDTQQAVHHFINTTSLLKQNPTEDVAKQISANHDQIWQLLKTLKPADLITLRGNNTDSIFQGWIDLSLASQHAINQSYIADWRSLYPDHPAQTFAQNLIENAAPATQASTVIASNSTIALVLPTPIEANNEKLQAFKLGLETSANLSNISNPVAVYYQDQMQAQEMPSADYFVVPDFTQSASNVLNENIAGKPTLYISLSMQDEADSIMAFIRQHNMQYLTVVTTQHEASQPMLTSLQQAWAQYVEQSGYDALHVITLDADVLAQPVKLLDLKSQIANQLHDIVILAMPAQDVVKIRPYLDISTPTMTFSAIHDIAFEKDTLKLLNALRFVEIPLLINSTQNMNEYRDVAQALQQKDLMRWFALGADSLPLLITINQNSGHTVLIQGLAGSYSISESGVRTRSLSFARFNQTGATAD